MREISIEKCENGFIVKGVKPSIPSPAPPHPDYYHRRDTYVFESVESLNDWIAGKFAQDTLE